MCDQKFEVGAVKLGMVTVVRPGVVAGLLTPLVVWYALHGLLAVEAVYAPLAMVVAVLPLVAVLPQLF